jgi:hypothetical protein
MYKYSRTLKNKPLKNKPSVTAGKLRGSRGKFPGLNPAAGKFRDYCKSSRREIPGLNPPTLSRADFPGIRYHLSADKRALLGNRQDC